MALVLGTAKKVVAVVSEFIGFQADAFKGFQILSVLKNPNRGKKP